MNKRITQPSLHLSTVYTAGPKPKLDFAMPTNKTVCTLHRPGIVDVAMLYEITTAPAMAAAPSTPPTPPPQGQQYQMQGQQQQQQQQTFHIPAEVLQAITEAPKTTDTVVKSLNAREEGEINAVFVTFYLHLYYSVKYYNFAVIRSI